MTAPRTDDIDVFELDDATGWRAINQTTGALADRPTPEEARIAVMPDDAGPVGFAPDHFRKMPTAPRTDPPAADLCGAILNCVLPTAHEGLHERADGIRWRWHENIDHLPRRTAPRTDPESSDDIIGRTDPTPDPLRALHHSSRCPASWRCRFAVKGQPNYDGSGYLSESERAADIAAHYEIYSGTADELRVALPSAGSAPDQRLREALDEAARDAHALSVRLLPNTTCSGPFETCPSIYCSKHRAALSEATTSPEATLDVAWREAEAALPDGWYFTGGSRGHDGYRFVAALGSAPTEAELRRSPQISGIGPTPAAALLTLAARLRGPA